MAAFLALACLGVSGVASEVNCFGPDSAKDSKLRIWQHAPPPRARNRDYRHWPVTDAATMQIKRLNESFTPTVRGWWWHWANRCHNLDRGPAACGWNRKGNFLYPRLIIHGVEHRPFFSTFERANGCTIIQAEFALGAEIAELERNGRDLGLTLSSDRDALERETVAGRNLIDVCIMPEARLPPTAAGIVLDYEVADRRTPEQGFEFLKRYASTVRKANKKVVLFANGLNAPSQRYTGITAGNANALHRLFDKMTVFLWHRVPEGSLADSLTNQLRVLRGGNGDLPVDPSRLIVSFELNNTTIADAAKVRELMLKVGIADVMFWRNRLSVGGSCIRPVNERIRCLVNGVCQ